MLREQDLLYASMHRTNAAWCIPAQVQTNIQNFTRQNSETHIIGSKQRANGNNRHFVRWWLQPTSERFAGKRTLWGLLSGDAAHVPLMPMFMSMQFCMAVKGLLVLKNCDAAGAKDDFSGGATRHNCHTASWVLFVPITISRWAAGDTFFKKWSNRDHWCRWLHGNGLRPTRASVDFWARRRRRLSSSW
jgi:hypothetical protein